MRITKTDFLEYSFCRKNLWLKKHKPELFDGVELSDFELKIIEEGNAADEAARNLFPQGVLIESNNQQAIDDTQQLLAEGKQVLFQATFADADFYIRADIIVYDEQNEGWELYEVKATSKVKSKDPENHIADLTFQKQVIESCGLNIVKTGVIHLNSEYTRDGDIDYDALFVIEDISDRVHEIESEIQSKMTEMKQYLNMPEDTSGCECLYRGRSKHCTTFQYSNPTVPEYAIYDLYRIGNAKKKLTAWVDEGRFSLDEVADEELNDRQRLQIDTYFKGKPYIDRIEIHKRLNELQFPLYFFDYEGLIAAIPVFDGFGPYEHVPFQYSLHVLHEDGEMEHKEFLITEMQEDITKPLVEQLVKDAAEQGTFVSWHASYERGRNDKLIELHPEYSAFLNKVNENMFDLEKIFTDNLYAHSEFKGKSSIKNILPVLVPELSYKALGIQKGDQASERWEHMIMNDVAKSERKQIANDLLEYCKMDTMAMVEIFLLLKKLQ